MPVSDPKSPDYDADAAVRSANGRIGGIAARGRIPTQEERNDALRSLAVARIDREIRQQMGKAPSPDAVNIAHLVGLLLSWGGASDGLAVKRLERAVAEAIYCTPGLTNADRERIAATILAGRGQG